MEKWRSLHQFWFENLETTSTYLNQRLDLWFRKNEALDERCRKEFYPWIKEVQKTPDTWKSSPQAWLSWIVLLDQIPRNAYRNDARAFEHDPIAQKMSLEFIDKGWELSLHPLEKVFLYLPLEHAEDLKIQKISVAKFKTLNEESPAAYKEFLSSCAEYAVQHLVIIEKFGRFPHRNPALKRTTTPQETEFLKTFAGF